MTGLIVSMFEGVNQSAYWQTYSKMDMWEEAIDIFLNGILR